MEDDLVIAKIFNQTVARQPDKTCLQIKQGSQWQCLSYAQLRDSSLRVARFLLQQDLARGDFVGLILENSPQWAVIYLGIVQAGLACVPLDPQLNQQEIEEFLSDCAATVIFCSSEIFRRNNLQRLMPNLKKIILLDEDIGGEKISGFKEISALSLDGLQLPQLRPSDTASLIYTSGTTGRPKGVVLSHANFCANSRSIQRSQLVKESDNYLAILPLYHTYAFMATLLTPLLSGATVTFCRSLNSHDIIMTIREAKVSIFVAVPQIFSLLQRAIFKRIEHIPVPLRFLFLGLMRAKIRNYMGRQLRLLVSGGAHLDPQVCRDLNSIGLRVIEGYGLTETSPVVTLSIPGKVKFGSAGQPVADVEIKIFQPDPSGVGEVLIRGPNLMQGYFRQPQLSASVLREGWFHSGDLGYIDKQGYLFLVGRLKEVIVLSSGKNIYPEELEEIYKASPYISEICILSKTEEKFGRQAEVLHAVVVPNLDYCRANQIGNIRAKIRWELENLGRDLPSYKRIMGFTLSREELPRTPLQKIKRYAVADKFLKQTGLKDEQGAAALKQGVSQIGSGIAAKVVDYLSRELKRPIDFDDHLEIDLGIDSLSRLEFEFGLGNLIGIRLPDGFIASASTVREVIEKLQAKAGDLSSTAIGARQSLGLLLKELPAQETRKRIKLEMGILEKALALSGKVILLLIFKLFFRLKVEESSPLPAQGPYIICPNHASYLDGFFIFSCLRHGLGIKTYFIGHAQIFEHPLVRWGIRLARLIPLDANTHLLQSLQAAAYVLRHHKIICIFPEGGRAVSDEIGDFKKGIGILVKELAVPVVPTLILGSHYSWPRLKRFPRPYPVKVVFSRPWAAAELKEKGFSLGAKDDYAAIALALRQEVERLKGG